jgi:1-acyl-sn-glycerol-3-phosphate acyltransferase
MTMTTPPNGPVNVLVRLAGHILFYTTLSTLFLCSSPIFIILLALPPRYTHGFSRLFCQAAVALMAVFLRLRYRVTGAHHLPQGGYIVASKHQSAWETVAFLTFLPHPSFVLKQELLRVPVLGRVLAHMGMIPVSRRSTSLKSGTNQDAFLHQGKTVIATEHRPVVIFPEGTRTKPGDQTRYRQGVIRLAQYTRAPIIPIALNSGVFWPPHTFFKKPGIIDVVILPPLWAEHFLGDGDEKTLLEALKQRIETASSNLVK